MAVRFDNAADGAQYRDDTGVGLGSAVTSTAIVWYRRETATFGTDVLFIFGNSFTNNIRLFDATNIRAISSNGGASASWPFANNTYGCFAVQRDTRYATAYAWTEAGVRTTLLNAYDGAYYSGNTTRLRLGDSFYSGTALGSYRYLRFWNRVLTPAQLDAEMAFTPTVGTPAASTSGLQGSWLLPDGTTATDSSGLGHTFTTMVGGVTSSNEPTIPAPAAGGAAIVAAYNQMLARNNA